MTAARWDLDRLAEELVLLGDRALALDQYYRAVAERVRRVFDFDAACWHTLDPQTRLMTGESPDELIEAGVFTPETAPSAGRGVVASEYLIDDVNTFAGLARRRQPVGILSEATRGHPERSARYRGVLAPAGIPFELRAAFTSRGRAWGAVHLARRDSGRDFTSDDATALARVTAIIADGIRTSLRFDAARHAHDDAAPGLIVLDASGQVDLITAPARELIAALPGPGRPQAGDTPPSAVLALASHLRGHPSDARAPVAAIAVPSADGWITLHASMPEGRADGRVAIVIERTPSPNSTALRLESPGVTVRERAAATLLAQGLTNPQIADTLVLSPYTVQDHIRNLFEKTGVRSRQELVARVFLDDYMTQIAQLTLLTSNGNFSQSAPT